MKSKCKRLAALTALTVVPLALGACSSSSGGSSSASSASSSSGATKLTVEDYYVPPANPVIETIYSKCATATGSTLTVQHVPGAGLIAKVLQQASSKAMPDVLMLDNPDVQQIAASGALSPLTDYGITGGGIAPGVVAGGTYQGQLYGLEPVANSIALFYNMDMFKAAGLTPPTTWADLQTDAAKLTKSGRYGLAFSGINTFEGTWQFMPFMWSNGGSEKDLNSPENVQALSFLTDLVKSGSASKSVVTWTQSDVNNQFIAGKAAMMVNGPWQIPSLQAVKGLNWAYVPIPARTAGQTPQSPLGGEDYTVPNTGDKAKMKVAGKFVQCLLNAENETANAQANNVLPTNLAAATAFAQANPSLAPLVDIIKNARSRTALLGADWPAAATKIYTAEQLALTGKDSPSAAFASAAG